MRVWRWYRGLQGWLRILIAAIGIPVIAAALYVGTRAVQYAAAEKNAGLYIPQSANVVLRIHDLERHWERIQATPAWRTLRRRVLGDPALRRQINSLLDETPVPNLNELEDERRRGIYTEKNLMLLAGRDVAAAAQVRNSWGTARVFGATRLPFLIYLGTPFAGWFVDTEVREGRTLLKVKAGGREFYVALEGALALLGTDPEFLQEALRRKGGSRTPKRPVEGRIEFAGAPALQAIRKMFRESGALPHINFDTVKGVAFECDIARGGARVDAVLTGAEAAHPFADPPHRFTRYAPANSTGVLVTNAGARDLYGWMEYVAATSSSRAVFENAGSALKTLNHHGFRDKFLPFVDHGMAILLGSEEDEEEGRQYPAVALVFASKDPSAARDGLHEVALGIAGSQAENSLRRELVEDAEILLWDVPGVKAFRADEFLRPCYVALDDAVIFANNSSFLRSIVVTAARGSRFRETGRYRSAARSLREYGFPEEPSFAGGLFALPLIRQSLDGLLPRLADYLADTPEAQAAISRQVDEEFRQLGVPNPSPEEVRTRFQAALKRRILEKERSFRKNLGVLDRVRWVAFESSSARKGMTLRVVVQLTDSRKGARR